MAKSKDPPYQFAGFSAPTYTQVPDALFDELLPVLSGAELKVLLYILRRTFGFKKAADSISYRQMLEGIVTADGRRLDHGAGLKSRSTVSAALKGLEEKNIIIAERRSSAENGQETTVYRPNMGAVREPVLKGSTPGEDPSSKIEPGGGSKNGPGGSPKIEPGGGLKNEPAPGTEIEPAPVQKSNPQETELQNTEQQQVVVALREAGLSGQVAQKLIKHFPTAHIEEKLAYLAFLQKSGRRVKRPAGWLRQAIEEDYSAPDGFERFGEAMLAPTLPVVHSPPPPRPPETSAREQGRRRWRWRPADAAVWEAVLNRLETTLPAAQMAHLAGSDLLTTRAGQGVVLVESARAQAWMAARFGDRILEALKRAGAGVDRLKFVTPAEASSEAPVEENGLEPVS